MAKQTINLGSSANDGTGDKLRVAFDKINDNFTELYEQGDKGAKGDKGEPAVGGSGAQGAQGVAGDKGATGAQGVQGEVGTKGDKGDVGVQGSAGSAGAQGGAGTKGDKGEPGGGGGGNYGNTNVAAYLLSDGVDTKANITFIRDEGFGDVPYFGFVNPDNATLKLQTNIAGSELNTDIISIDRETQNVKFNGNVVVNSLRSGDVWTNIRFGFNDDTDANGKYLQLRTGDDDAHIHLDSGDMSAYDQYWGNDSKYVKLDRAGNVVIRAYDSNTAAANAWTYTPDGDLKLPVNSVVNFGQGSETLGIPAANGANDRIRLWDFEGGGSGYNYAIGAEGNHMWFTMDVNNGTGGFKFYSRDSQIFKIRDDGALIFQDNTVQNTAYTGTAGPQGAQGLAGDKGDKGETGAKGDKGVDGAQGQNGNFGGATFNYTFTTNTANTDPSAGFLKFNTSDPIDATELYIDDQDKNTTDIQSFIRTIDDSSSTIKGHFRISLKNNAAIFGLYTISSLHENNGYYTVNCAYVSGSNVLFDNADDIIITFARTGDIGDKGEKGTKGDVGAQGVQGAVGDKGEVGVQGAQGLTGDKGEIGAQGAQGSVGVQGSTGDKGEKGEIGVQGDKGDIGAQGASGANISWPIAVYPTSGNTANDGIIFPSDPGGGSGDIASIKWYPVTGESTRLHIEVNNDDNDEILIDASGSVKLQSYNKVWDFKDNGSLVFPDSTTQTTAFTANPTVNILNVKEVIETTNALSSATGTVTHNCALGHIFVHSSVSANFTANFTDVTIPANTATAFTLVINQSSTAYVANLVQIGGVAQTVNWQGSTTAPAGNANKKDVISFSVVNNNGTFITLGQLTTFG
jgi:hypothetical protein